MTALLLDHTGRPIQPTQQRPARLRYEAATTRETEEYWPNTDSLSAAAAHDPSVRKTLRERSRAEAENNPVCCGIVRTLVNDIIGTGPRLQVAHDNPEAAQSIEHEWRRWWRANNLTESLRIMRRAMCVDGESFAVLAHNGGSRNPVKLSVRLFETEQVANPFRAFSDPIQSDGIIYDDWGNPIAYSILRQHPGGTGWLSPRMDAEIVSAANVVHLFAPERPGQTRGVPEITSTLTLFAQLRRYQEAVIQAAETAADLAMVLETQQSPNTATPLQPLEAIPLHPGASMALPAGWKASQLRAEQPTQTYVDFRRTKVGEAARPLGMPYGTADANHQNYNYASGKLDSQGYERSIEIDRCRIEGLFLSRLFAAWWQEAAMVGVVPAEEQPEDHWYWDGRGHQDPAKEANALQTRLSVHADTLANHYSRQGKDWEVELRQRAKESALLKQLGLMPAEQDTGTVDDDVESDE